MKSTVLVDEVGRLVLPKEIREAIGIFGRMSVQVEVVGGSAQISAPPVRGGAMERRGKRSVYAGPVPSDWDSGAAVLEIRERRIRQ